MRLIVDAEVIAEGQYFRKRSGGKVHLRLSAKSVQHHGLNPRLVYGASPTGDLISVSPTSLVELCTVEDFAESAPEFAHVVS